MSLIRDTYLRFQVLIHEVAKFGVVGIVSTVLTFGIQNLLYPNHTGPTTAVVIANAVATVFAFFGNRYWAFRNREGSGLGNESVLFIVFNVSGIFITAGVVDAIVYGTGHRDRLAFNLATVVGVGLATLFRLFCYRKFVFHTQKPGNSGGDTTAERSNIPHKHLSPEEAQRAASDEHLSPGFSRGAGGG